MARLTEMPPEVLNEIYDWLRLIERARFTSAWTPADGFPFTWEDNSHALRPYTQRYRYHNTSAKTPSKLGHFARKVSAAPELGPCVRELRVGDVMARGEASGDGRLRARLARMWPALTSLRVVRVENMDGAVSSLLAAVARGCRLPNLRELAVTSSYGGGVGAWDPAKWRAVLAAAPNLDKLSLDLSQRAASPTSTSRTMPITPIASFDTHLTTLDLSGFEASQSLAIAAFANAFTSLTDLSLSATTRIEQPKVVAALQLPQLRSFSYQWLVQNEIRCEPLAHLDLRHLPALREVKIATAVCSPDFRFLLPRMTTRVVCEVWNTVPLRALLALIEPGPDKLSSLKEIKLDLAFGDPYPFPVGHSEDEMARWKLEELYDDLPRWTDEVSRAGLTRLLRVAERHGVEISGTATAVFDFERAVLRRHQAGHVSLAWDEDDLDELYMYWDEEYYMDDELDSEWVDSDEDHRGNELLPREVYEQWA